MSTIVTRAGKGSPLTNAEVDANFINLNTDKVQVSGTPVDGQPIAWSSATSTWVPAPFLQFDLNPAVVPTTPGALYWDSADGNQTLNLVMAGGTATQQIGEEQYYRIKASSAITNGQVVMFTGTVGASGALTGAPAYGLTASTASYVMGIATQDIPTNGWGYVTSFGLVRQLNTSAFSAGAILYLDPTVAGGLTATIPSAPNPKVQVCACIYSSASNGSLFIRPSFGGVLGQYEGDVSFTSLADGDLLVRNQATGVWENKAQSTITAGNVSGTVAINNGGTGQTAFTANYIHYGSFSSSASLQFDGTTMRVGANALLTGAVNPIVGMTGSANSYIQSYIFNASTGISASADFTAYANNSTDAHGWADMGFTGSNYADTVYTVTGPNEAYLFGSALNSTYTGNLVYATDSTGSANAHQWYVGGFTQAKSAWKMQLASTGLQVTSLGVGTAASGTAGEIRATNNVTAYYSSDAQFKENVVPVTNASAIVKAIGAYHFDWTDAYITAHGGEDGYFVQKSDFGVIAQNVQAVFPKAVRTRPDGSLAVDYAKLGVLAFAALAEQDERLDRHERMLSLLVDQ